MKVVFGDKPETILFTKPDKNSKKTNHVLMGTYLQVTNEKSGWYEVVTKSAGRGGWVKKSDVRDNPGLKVFYVDVGQGDGAIIELSLIHI